MTITLTPALASEYERLWDAMVIRPERAMIVAAQARKVLFGRERYQEVAAVVGCPWELIGVIHSLEGNLRWDTHLHNGNPLSARTFEYPAGRPVAPPRSGHLPYEWDESAIDALSVAPHNFRIIKDWTTARQLFELEKYNGMAYHKLKKPINSPYLWSFTTHYTRGKFIRDHVYDPQAVSRQVGAAPLLREIRRLGA